MLQRLGDVVGASTGSGDGWPIRRLIWINMGTRQVILEKHFARLKGKVRAGLVTSAGGSHVLSDGLSVSFEHIINELIVFGLLRVPSENYTETITKISSSLDVSMSLWEIARAFGIPGRIRPRLCLLSNSR